MNSFTLRLENIFGEIVSEDEINLGTGDILVCKINTTLTMETYNSIAQTIQRCFDNQTGYLIIPDFVDIKILKVRKGE